MQLHPRHPHPPVWKRRYTRIKNTARARPYLCGYEHLHGLSVLGITYDCRGAPHTVYLMYPLLGCEKRGLSMVHNWAMDRTRLAAAEVPCGGPLLCGGSSVSLRVVHAGVRPYYYPQRLIARLSVGQKCRATYIYYFIPPSIRTREQLQFRI